MSKLNEYQDIGIEPEQIRSFLKDFGISAIMSNTKLRNKLKEYKDLEEKGLLIKLPCKVGDIVYSVNTVNSSIYEHEIKNFMITDTGEYTYAQNAKSGYQFKLSDFGKTVFLTREEAEKALTGLN